MRVVVALGGNALLRRGESPALDVQRVNAQRAAAAIAPLARAHELIVTHGNGPQVGLLALLAEASAEVPPYPLDVLGAESEGLIGYLLEQALRVALPGREIATLLTQVEVDAHDPGFAKPSKPIGPVYTRETGERLAAQRGWTLAPDGAGVRRCVPSPEPLRILELASVRHLLAAGVLVVCAGGGGIPVIASGDALAGAEAVVDKDLSAALLARELGADALLLLTDVPAIFRDWPRRDAPLARTTPAQLRGLGLAAGSMGPKAEAACRFAETGGFTTIGALEDAVRLLAGAAGTRIGDTPRSEASNAAAATR
jgi:carbamate kinase